MHRFWWTLKPIRWHGSYRDWLLLGKTINWATLRQPLCSSAPIQTTAVSVHNLLKFYPMVIFNPYHISSICNKLDLYLCIVHEWVRSTPISSTYLPPSAIKHMLGQSSGIHVDPPSTQYLASNGASILRLNTHGCRFVLSTRFIKLNNHCVPSVHTVIPICSVWH